jgi:transposase
MTYSIDLRKKVLEVQSKNDWSNAKTAKHFGISATSVIRWNKNIEKKANIIRPQIKIDLDVLKKDLEEKRAIFIKKIEDYELQGKKIIYLDESGFSQDDYRKRGYARIGQR